MRSAEKNKLSGAGQNIIHQRERLLNLQKRQKLKDLPQNLCKNMA